jgi:2-polyprenyl-3-methyl-5-hydroxy-6-metoxy-1,4-benzoquinol methylase
MREYYEELWERLPDELHPPELKRRSELLQSELRWNDRVLDLGCGAGYFSALAAASGAIVTGADVAQEALRRAHAANPGIHFELVPFDGLLPFDDTSFDLVWASEVIEHVADTANWLSEVRRVLVPGGAVVITTPAHGRLRLLVHGVERYSDPQGDHLHLYTKRSLRELLREFGFSSVEVGSLSGPPLMRRTLWARASR